MSTLTAPRLAAAPSARRPRTPARRGPAPRIRWDRVAALALAVLVMAWVLAGALAGTSEADVPAGDPVHVVVQPGDTLWDLARTHAPAGMGPLEYVALVEQANGVRAGALLPGSLLVLPQP